MPELSNAISSVHWRHFIAAPHRMFFFGGVWALVLSIAWWGLVLLPAPIASPAPHWIHGWLLVFCAFPFFVFGFLMTALPRWLGAPRPVPPTIYRPSALALMAGFLLTLIGALWYEPIALLGMGLTCLTWLVNLLILGRLLVLGKANSKLHPIWALAVLTAGILGALTAVRGFMAADIISLRLAPQIGLWAFLGPLVFVIGHRMLPFFASSALGGDYRLVRPRWSPPVVVLLLWAHATLTLMDHAGLLFIVDLPLLIITVSHLIAWQPWKTRHNPLLWTLFTAFAWLPVALTLSAIQSLMLQISGVSILGYAPLHALAIGLAASMVFAMATRVSMGHSGRSLYMPRFAVVCFVILQLAVITRLGAEIDGALPVDDSLMGRGFLLALSAICWLCAFIPWAIRLSLIYWQPRIDGRPG